MGIGCPPQKTHRLNPEFVRQVILQDEIPLRCQSLNPDTVQIVFRYGGMVGNVIELHRQLPRGMDRGRQLIRAAQQEKRSFASGTTIVAAEMTGSKGRFQRSWHAPTGGLWLTVVLVDTLLPENRHLYPLAAGAACCETLRRYNIPAVVKWVNDVQVRGKKIAGILAETESSPACGEEYILLGIGINVNNDSFPTELASTATSLCAETGAPVDVDLLTARLLAKLAWYIGLLSFEEQQALEQKGLCAAEVLNNGLVLDLWRWLSDTAGRRVLFGYDVQKKPLFEAIAEGVNADGALLLRLDDGTTVVENSGEIIYID